MMPDLRDSRASPHGESIPSVSVGVMRRDPGCLLRAAQFPLSHAPKETSSALLGVASSVDITMATRQYHAHQIRSDQISHSVVSDSLRPHESQHASPPIHHQLPEFTETHVHRVSDAIQPSHPLSSPSPPAPNPSQHQSLFQ